jgi:hypothetical protein
VADTWPILVAAGLLRRGHRPDLVARHCGLSVAEVDAIAHRLHRADERHAARGRERGLLR